MILRVTKLTRNIVTPIQNIPTNKNTPQTTQIKKLSQSQIRYYPKFKQSKYLILKQLKILVEGH